ncbi:hypothetical protein EJ04DRAFT_571292 [Polyplosphaeria fusca]|uniref:Uncharacterized protein n=1 Tax=Polyplosphaeria fusca TaxID=682080 RepID=A0A9P4QK69_9PLEO|nr:hypothetical protein EJ04DRAFT_571292 [Polyplosphaeria fusca]
MPHSTRKTTAAASAASAATCCTGRIRKATPKAAPKAAPKATPKAAPKAAPKATPKAVSKTTKAAKATPAGKAESTTPRIQFTDPLEKGPSNKGIWGLTPLLEEDKEFIITNLTTVLSSSPPVQLSIRIDVSYLLLVNNKKAISRIEKLTFGMLSLMFMEDFVEEMMGIDESGLNGQTYSIIKRTIQYKVGKHSVKTITISNFGIEEDTRICEDIKDLLSRSKPNVIIELRLEVSVEALGLKPAFKRNQAFNELLSDPTESAQQPRVTPRVSQLLKEYQPGTSKEAKEAKLLERTA